MLTQYKNINQIQLAPGSLSGERLSSSKTTFASFDADEAVYFNTEINTQTANQRVELHVYANDTWITGNHRITLKSQIPEYRNLDTNALISFPAQPLAINLYEEFDKLKLTSGNFRFVINFFKNLIGNYDQQQLRIDEISPDRTELRLRAIDSDNPIFLSEITTFAQTVKQTDSANYKNYLLNFSRNNCVLFINSVVIGEYVYVKLNEPLADDIVVDFKCWIVEEQKDPYIDRVSIAAKEFIKQFNKLANPNWQAADTLNLSSETGLKSWSDLLGSSTQTSQQIVDTYFSGSLSGIQLNIDYSDFNNFIFYSSATDRLINFKYKLELLEYYTSQSLVISQISGSDASANSSEYESYRTKLISGFDAFEKYLYFESASNLTTYDIAKENAVYPDLTGSYIQPVPKSNSTYPYTLYGVNSSQFNSWYNTLIESSSLYDSFNVNAIEYNIPEFIRFNADNAQLVTFVRMLGHHYDIIYSYVNHMNLIHSREENPKLGMPNELLYSVAKQFGWNLSNGNQQQELWSYALGTDINGVPATGSNSINGMSMSAKDRTYTIWRRIVNNLPLLLKSKGTKRSVQALLSCYGIPQSMISINEYGGPRIDRAPIYEKLNFDYALDLITSPSGSVTINYTAPINAFELRFRLDNVVTNPLIPNQMNLVTVGGNTVTIDFVSGNKGVLTINGNPTQPIEIFDGEWASMLLRNNGFQVDLLVKKSKFGKIVAAVSASDNTSYFGGSGNVLIGGTFGGSRLYGQIQELRLWSSSLQDSAFDNHVKAPAAYDGNEDAYSELLFRLPLTQKINHTLTGSLVGIQPMSSSISASFTGWTQATPYDSIEETYYYDSVSLGAGTYDDNKIRIESTDLIGTLDVKKRAERSQYDRAPLDSKKLGVYFSPQTMIDEDIIAQLGFTDLDQYIGDPGDTELTAYPRLIQAAQSYWKKYADKNDINAYIKIFTLFDLSFFTQLNQLLPARTDKITGILIQPNILERSKATILPTIKRFDSSYSVVITEVAPTASGAYLQYLGAIDGDILNITAQDDDQWQAYLTASQAKRYDGTTYSYEYLVRSGSTYITASSPYWQSEAVCPAITSSVFSEYKTIKTSYYIIDCDTIKINYNFEGEGNQTVVADLVDGEYRVNDFLFGTDLIISPSETGWNVFYSFQIQASLTVDGCPFGTFTLPEESMFASFYITQIISTTYPLAEVQDYLPTGIDNQRYAGTKMSSPGFNIVSTQTVDGGAVAEWRTANPNQLIYQNNGEQGSFVLT